MQQNNIIIVRFKGDTLQQYENILEKIKQNFSDVDIKISLPKKYEHPLRALPNVSQFVLDEIKAVLGSWSAIARLCSVSDSCVSQWRSKCRVPHLYIKKIVDAANREKGCSHFKYKALSTDWLD